MSGSGHGRFSIAGTLAAMGALLCWSIGPIYIKLLSGHLDFWTQNAARYSVACLFWLPFLVYRILAGRLDRRIWLLALVPSAANVAMQSFWALSFYHINPAFMSLLSKSSVLWVAAFSVILFRSERALLRSKRFWVGITLAVAGVFGVIFSHRDFALEGSVIGIVFTSSAAFLWAVYMVSVKVFCHDIDSRCSFAVISGYSTVGLVALAMCFGDVSRIAQLDMRPWSWVIISAVVAIAIGHVLYYVAIKRIGATIPALLLLATPFIILSISHFLFDETLTVAQTLFGLVLITGAAISTWAQQHLAPSSELKCRMKRD